MRSHVQRAAWLVCIVAAVLVARAGVDGAAARLHTSDTNHDGRPDVWQYFDDRGVLLHTDIDTNFDGRSDVEESYADGQLIRRQSDSNFDDRVDRIDDFDAATGRRTHSVVDFDFDGRADVEVFLANGEPVYVQYADVDRDVRPPVDQAEQRGANAPLLTLDDPFASASRVCAQVRRTDSGSRVELASKLPAAKAPSCDMPVSGLRAAAVTRPQNVRVFARNPRAPPQRSFTP